MYTRPFTSMPFHESSNRPERSFRRRAPFSPARILVLTFVVLIAAGTILLALPVSSTSARLSLIDALFTATSAVCVTGLIVADTPVDFSTFGQVVILMLIQLGGLGYMAITTAVGVALGRQLTMQERLTLQEALNVDTLEGLARFVFTVLKLILAFELAGAVILTVAWAGDLGWGRAAWVGVFHSVSAFNNAGFSLFSDNLMGYRGDWVVNLTICALVICGGLGFVVLTEVGRTRRLRALSRHTRLVLVMSGALIVLATVFIFLVERGNPRTLGSISLPDAALAAFFQAVVPRTAGFNTVDIGALHHATLFALLILMFIGGAPGGTAGGSRSRRSAWRSRPSGASCAARRSRR
jgi:trk system potassium uptake protein